MGLNCYCTAVLPLCIWAMERWVRGHQETGFYSVKKKHMYAYICLFIYLCVCFIKQYVRIRCYFFPDSFTFLAPEKSKIDEVALALPTADLV